MVAVNKRSFGARVCGVADRYGIHQTHAHTIIISYIAYCRECLIGGMPVSFHRLVSIIPNSSTQGYCDTLAYQCRKVAAQCGLGYHTVHTIVKGYLGSLEEDVMQGMDVDIRGIVSMHPLTRGGDVVKVHSAISVSVKRDMELAGNNMSVRVHTNKGLRRMMKKLATGSVFALED